MDRNSKTGGKKPLGMALTGSPKAKPAISFEPRTLTPSERDFLRRDLRNTIAEARAVKV